MNEAHSHTRTLAYLHTCLLATLLLVGCQPAAVMPPAAVPTVAATTIAAATAVPPTPTTPPTPIPTTVPTTQPAIQFTPTPRPPVVLAVAPEWADVTAETANQLNVNRFTWEWRLIVNDDPAGQLAAGRAGVALVRGREGTIVRQEPVALAVPFTTEWESVSGEEAQEIYANGHALVSVMAWADMPPTHKALRIDGRLPADPDYPLQDAWSLMATPGYETAVTELLPVLWENMPPQPVVHLAAVGDIMLDRALGAAIRQGDLAYPFVYVADLLRAADVAIGNLESALGDVGQPAAKHYTFRAPPPAAQSLALAGFDVITLANNHAMDYGPEALLQGITLLQEQGVAAIGAGANETEAHAPAIRQVNGLTLAFLGYVHVPVEASSNFDTTDWTATAATPGLAWGTPEQIAAGVTAARPQADIVIVVLHSGLEYIEEPSEPQVAAAHAAINAGADLVIGHHAHILQGIEFYNDGVIVYGLGNFAFEIEGAPETAVLNVWLDKNGVRQLEILPAIIQFGGQPRLAETGEAAAIRRQVYFLTNLLNVP